MLIVVYLSIWAEMPSGPYTFLRQEIEKADKLIPQYIACVQGCHHHIQVQDLSPLGWSGMY